METTTATKPTRTTVKSKSGPVRYFCPRGPHLFDVPEGEPIACPSCEGLRDAPSVVTKTNR